MGLLHDPAGEGPALTALRGRLCQLWVSRSGPVKRATAVALMLLRTRGAQRAKLQKWWVQEGRDALGAAGRCGELLDGKLRDLERAAL